MRCGVCISGSIAPRLGATSTGSGGVDMTSTRTERGDAVIALFAVCAVLFVASATLTIILCLPMSAMGMPMPGGWTMSMAWMRMPGQTWLDASASFLWMWVVMMVAMMLPSLVPMLLQYRR